ncbi:hypothetical protein [Cupriavidus basilensis]|uniref:hypothetical protein n=1 Tax=Cupriavidus basilensis TaxID=68895 RepID=UPI0020A63C67|nr:hypothetical protein [Cupriavidus basilensis]MCP3018203.1 hypothetical protein [Cupriavidus basilensis]
MLHSTLTATHSTVVRRPKVAPIETSGLTVEQVESVLYALLRGMEIEPEWITPTNRYRDDERIHGLHAGSLWPELGARDRLAVSVFRGWSEGWTVNVERIHLVTDASGQYLAAQKLLCAKVFGSDLAFMIARVISEALDLV